MSPTSPAVLCPTICAAVLRIRTHLIVVPERSPQPSSFVSSPFAPFSPMRHYSIYLYSPTTLSSLNFLFHYPLTSCATPQLPRPTRRPPNPPAAAPPNLGPPAQPIIIIIPTFIDLIIYHHGPSVYTTAEGPHLPSGTDPNMLPSLGAPDQRQQRTNPSRTQCGKTSRIPTNKALDNT